MPKGYVVFTVDIKDEKGMADYQGAAVPVLLAAGGRLIVGGPPVEVLEGTWHGAATAILEFESVEAARTWYKSEEYQAVIGKRHAAAESNVAIFEEFEMPSGGPT